MRFLKSLVILHLDGVEDRNKAETLRGWELLIPREKAVYVGDSEVDVATARNAHMDSLIVEWGFRKADFLRENGAKILIKKPEEILSYCLD